MVSDDSDIEFLPNPPTPKESKKPRSKPNDEISREKKRTYSSKKSSKRSTTTFQSSSSSSISTSKGKKKEREHSVLVQDSDSFGDLEDLNPKFWENLHRKEKLRQQEQKEEQEEKDQLRGGTGEYGIQLDTTTPIRHRQRFWEGGVKLSYNEHADSKVKGVRFSEFFLPATLDDKGDLRHVILGSYGFDIFWLKKMIPEGVPVTLVGREENLDPEKQALPFGWNLQPIDQLKPEDRGPCMHMKFILASFETHLRFCLLTGNMNEPSWSMSENSALIFDSPKRSNRSSKRISDLNLTSSDTTSNRSKKNPQDSNDSNLNGSYSDRLKGFSLGTDFLEQLLLMLDSLQIEPSHPIYEEIKSERYDFSKVPFQLVLSVPGSNETEENEGSSWEEIETFGLGRLKKVLRNMEFDFSVHGVKVEALGSSLGSYTFHWLKLFEAICSGGKEKGIIKRIEPKPKIQVLFPSQKWVENFSFDSLAGFFGKNYPERGIHDLLHQPISRRGKGIKIHSKSILAIQSNLTLKELEENLPRKPASPPSKSKSKVVGFSYVGSANFTSAAWGSLTSSPQKQTLQWPKNFELGAVVPLTLADLDTKSDQSLARSFLAYKRDSRKFEEGDPAWINPERDDTSRGEN